MTSHFQIANLRCEYLVNPLGIDVIQPRLSWILQSERRGARQSAYQIRVIQAREDGIPGEVFWDSGKVTSDQTAHIAYQGKPLTSQSRFEWQVRAWDEFDRPSEWSETAWWEMGLLDRSDWRAKWIGGSLVGGARTSIPCPYFRKAFSVARQVSKARLYITALGVYQATINGIRVGDDELNPGWTDFHKRVRYRVYDVKDLLLSGDNAIGVVLGDGWYCGNLEWRGRQLYGDRPKLIAQLLIEYSDHTSDWVISDESWTTAYGPLLEADLLMGESYDARLEFPGWDQPGFIGKNWLPVEVFPDENVNLVATNTPTIKAIEEIEPISNPIEIPGWPASTYIYDMGQNMVGRVRLKVKGPAGTTITLRYGEMLTENTTGTLYTANLRTARQTDYFTLKGEGEEVFEPRFTFHGFRYVEVKGYPGVPTREMLTGIVLHSDMKPTGSFECSDPLINQLQHNIVWGQKGNYLDVPTDCPQRDERLGWTGDAQVFVRTATFNFDVASFFTKWQQDLADAQHPLGAIPPIAPNTDAVKTSDGGPAWADAVVICPWTMYLCYGDKRLLEQHYDSLANFMNFLLVTSPDFIRARSDRPPKDTFEWLWEGFGDWLAQDGSGKVFGGTPKDLIGTAYFAYCAQLMARIAGALGKSDDAERFTKLYEDVRQAFNRRYVTADGLVIGQTQTAYVLALHFGLLDEAVVPKVVQALVRDIESRKMHLSTGFVGTPYLPHVLTRHGHLDTAYQLLMQKTYPSWLYPVTQGATTIWERWDGWTHDKGFQDPGMNSFNHYAYGSIGAWMYAVIAGIDADPEQPGFKHFILRPRPGGGLTYARATYDSIHGTIVSDWKIKDGCFYWDITIPANTSATVYIPADDDSVILEGDQPVEEMPGIVYRGKRPNSVEFEFTSGKYHLAVEPYRMGL